MPRKVPFARALQRFYWERRRNVYARCSFKYDERMNMKDNVPLVNVMDPTDLVRPLRKRLKYSIIHVINMRRAAMERRR